MKIIKEWKNDRGYTFQFIADLIGATVGHVQNVYHGRVGFGAEYTGKVKTINRLLNLIDGAPNDTILLKYELSQYTGLSIDEFEEANSKAERKITREAEKSRLVKKKNLRLCTLKSLERIRQNGYESLTRAGKFFDREEIDAEIKRKVESKAFKGMKYNKIMEKRAVTT